jgi:aminomethyltransferase
MKRTPLFSAHQKLGGKLIEFGGWEMPVHYTSIMDEHLAVRQAAGLFDISHMGEVFVSGPGAEDFLNRVLTNDARKLAIGQGQYTLMCRETGGVIDDLYAYRLAPEQYLLIINAARIEVDMAWLDQQWRQSDKPGQVSLIDASQTMGAVAVQGPAVAGFIGGCFPGASTGGTEVANVGDLKKNQVGRFNFAGKELWVSRTGYTGEDGFEAVAPAGQIGAVWDCLLGAGKPHGLKPAGLGARDTLRTEVCYPLYGHELDEHTTPIEAGLGFFVALEGKGEFRGREIMLGQRAKGAPRKLVAFKMTDRSAPPRPHYPIWSADGARLGEVTSGTQSPSLGIGIGMGYVPPESARAGTPVEIEIRGKRASAVVVAKPIYRKTGAGVK